MNIPGIAVGAAQQAGDSFGLELASYDIERLLEAAAPSIAAQALREAAEDMDGLGIETVTAGSLWSRADKLEAPND